MEKATRKNIESAFLAFCKRQGFKRAESYKDIGALSLDYNPYYGGYQIIRYQSNGGEHNLTERYSAKEFFAFLRISAQFDLNKGTDAK